MRIDRTAAVFASLILLAACEPEEAENIQAKTDETINMLENRAQEISAKAENVTDEAASALDNQAALLANQAEALRNASGNEAEANRQ